MDTYAQLEMLTAVIANLSVDGIWTEREVPLSPLPMARGEGLSWA